MNMGPFTSIFVMQSLFTNLLTSPHHVSTSMDGSPQLLLTNHRRGGGPYVPYDLDTSKSPSHQEKVILHLINASETNLGPYPPPESNSANYGPASEAETPTESSIRPRRESKDDSIPVLSVWNNILDYFRKRRSSDSNDLSPQTILNMDTILHKKDHKDGVAGDSMIYSLTGTAQIDGLRIEVKSIYLLIM